MEPSTVLTSLPCVVYHQAVCHFLSFSGCPSSEKTVWRNDLWCRRSTRELFCQLSNRSERSYSRLHTIDFSETSQQGLSHDPCRYTRAYLHVCTPYTHRGWKSERVRQEGKERQGWKIREGESATEKGRRSKGGKDKASTRSKFGRTSYPVETCIHLSFSFCFSVRRFPSLVCTQTTARPISFPFVKYIRATSSTHIHPRTSRCQLHTFLFPLAGFLREIKHGHKIKYTGSVYLREAHYQVIRSEHDRRARRKQTVQNERVNARTGERTRTWTWTWTWKWTCTGMRTSGHKMVEACEMQQDETRIRC